MSETTVRINGDTFAKIGDVWYDTYGDEVVADAALCAALDALAAARAQVEAMTARLEIDPSGSDKIDELTDALEYVRAQVETLTKDLAAVRKVQDSLLAFANHRALYPGDEYGETKGFMLMHDGDVYARGESIPAIGRALAAQEGEA